MRVQRSFIHGNDISISYIAAIETLGYPKNTDTHVAYINDLLGMFYIMYSNETIMEYAVELKRAHNIKTPDSIIAATAKYLWQPLVTADKKLHNLSGLTTISYEL